MKHSDLPTGLLPSTAEHISDEVVSCWVAERSFIHRYARSIGADYDEAEDICQEAVFALARYWPIRNVKGFLSSTVHVAYKDIMYRKFRRHERVWLNDKSEFDYLEFRLDYEEPRGNDLAEQR